MIGNLLIFSELVGVGHNHPHPPAWAYSRGYTRPPLAVSSVHFSFAVFVHFLCKCVVFNVLRVYVYVCSSCASVFLYDIVRVVWVKKSFENLARYLVASKGAAQVSASPTKKLLTFDILTQSIRNLVYTERCAL